MTKLLPLFLLVSFSVLKAEKPQPIPVSKSVQVVLIMPDGSLQLKKDASWEDAAYALLEAAKNLDQIHQKCNAELADLKRPKEQKTELLKAPKETKK